MKELRKFIRAILAEQVVGYTPPSSSSSGSRDDEDFMQAGDISAPAPAQPTETDDPEDEEQLQTQRQQINKQRQQDMNKGNAVGANYDARVAKKTSKSNRIT